MTEDTILVKKIRNYIKAKEEDKCSKNEKVAQTKLKSISNPNEYAQTKHYFESKRLKIIADHVPSVWLTNASERAKQVNFATHCIKYTHQDIKASNIFCSYENKDISRKYLCTESLSSPTIDVACSAGVLDVAAFLQLADDHASLFLYIINDDPSPLRPFAKDQEQLDFWIRNFKKADDEDAARTHTLAKQVYFPLGDGTYHLISPLYASSLADSIFDKIKCSRNSEISMAARQAKKEGKPFNSDVVNFPGLAIQHFGGSKPQNISKLNSARYGIGYLLNCAPPKWEKIKRPPVKSKSIFNDLERRVYRDIKVLQEYLIKVAKKTSNLDIRCKRQAFIDHIIGELFHLVSNIRSMTDFSGWSLDSSLPEHQKCWLDPCRSDALFIDMKKKDEWQDKVADEFALWLNKSLNHDELKFGDAEHRAWKKCLLEQLHVSEISRWEAL